MSERFGAVHFRTGTNRPLVTAVKIWESSGVLIVVLILVLGALALLVTALVTSTMLWAWGSVGVSLVAILVLVLERIVRRRRRGSGPTASTDSTAVAETETTVVRSASDERSGEDAQDSWAEEHASDWATSEQLSEVAVDDAESTATSAPVSEPPDPDEENVDPDELRVVAQLEEQVRVVDEHPRYHLDSCRWLYGRATLPIPLREAHELGFTPCATCGPVHAHAIASDEKVG